MSATCKKTHKNNAKTPVSRFPSPNSIFPRQPPSKCNVCYYTLKLLARQLFEAAFSVFIDFFRHFLSYGFVPFPSQPPTVLASSAKAPHVIARSAKRDAAIPTKHRNAPRANVPRPKLCTVDCALCTAIVIARSAKRDAAISTKHRNAPRANVPRPKLCTVDCALCTAIVIARSPQGRRGNPYQPQERPARKHPPTETVDCALGTAIVFAWSAKRDAAIPTKHRNAPRATFPRPTLTTNHSILNL
jgi:hypothetical protein